MSSFTDALILKVHTGNLAEHPFKLREAFRDWSTIGASEAQPHGIDRVGHIDWFKTRTSRFNEKHVQIRPGRIDVNKIMAETQGPEGTAFLF